MSPRRSHKQHTSANVLGVLAASIMMVLAWVALHMR